MEMIKDYLTISEIDNIIGNMKNHENFAIGRELFKVVFTHAYVYGDPYGVVGENININDIFNAYDEIAQTDFISYEYHTIKNIKTLENCIQGTFSADAAFKELLNTIDSRLDDFIKTLKEKDLKGVLGQFGDLLNVDTNK